MPRQDLPSYAYRQAAAECLRAAATLAEATADLVADADRPDGEACPCIQLRRKTQRSPAPTVSTTYPSDRSDVARS